MQTLEQHAQPIEGGVELVKQLRRCPLQRRAAFDPRLHVVGELADAHHPGHAGAAFESVKRALQCRRVLHLGRLLAPGAQQLAGLRYEFHRFLDEQRQQLGVDVIVDAAAAALGRALCGRRDERLGAAGKCFQCPGEVVLSHGRAACRHFGVHLAQGSGAAREQRDLGRLDRRAAASQAKQCPFERVAKRVHRLHLNGAADTRQRMRRAHQVVVYHSRRGDGGELALQRFEVLLGLVHEHREQRG